MKTECSNAHWVDELSVKIKLTKQDVGDLLSTGVLRDSIGYREDKKIKVEIELEK